MQCWIVATTPSDSSFLQKVTQSAHPKRGMKMTRVCPPKNWWKERRVCACAHICVVCRQGFYVQGRVLLREFLVCCLQTGQRESASTHQPYAERGGCRNFIVQNKAWPLLNRARSPINPPSRLIEIPSLLPLLPNNAFFWHLPLVSKR